MTAAPYKPNRPEKVGDIWAFNPAELGERGLMATLVGREELLADICKWLRANKGRAPERHRLFYGPRGIGKTTVLCAVYYTVLAERDLLGSFIPVVFPENTAQMPDEFHFVTAVYRALDATGAKLGLTRAVAEHKWQANLDSLVELSAKTGRQFVFFVDNLQAFVDAVLEGRGRRADSASRKASQSGPQFLERLLQSREFLLIACSLRSGPVYAQIKNRRTRNEARVWSLFHGVELAGMSTLTEANLLIEKRAQVDGEEDLPRRLLREEGRIRGVFELSNGNPRYLVLLYRLLRHESFEGIQADFKRILDGLSAVIEDEVNRQVTPTQLPVLSALCKLGGRGRSHEVAEACGIPGTKPNPAFVRKVSGTLRALTSTDFVEEVNAHGTAYQTRPPLFQLCFELRFLGKSHRLVLLELFRTFPVSGKEAGAAYRSLVNELRARPDLIPARIGDAVFWAHLIEDRSESLTDLLELGREAVRHGAGQDYTRLISEFRDHFRKEGDVHKYLQAGLLKAQSTMIEGAEHGLVEEADVDSVLKEAANVREPETLQAPALLLKAQAQLANGEAEKARQMCRDARSLLENAAVRANPLLVGDLWSTEGQAATMLQDYASAAECFMSALKCHREAQDPQREMKDTSWIGVAVGTTGDHQAAATWFEESIKLAETIGRKEGLLWPLLNLTLAHRHSGQFDQTIATGERVAALAREVRDLPREATALRIVAETMFVKGDFERAASVAERAAGSAHDAKDRDTESSALGIAAEALLRSGKIERAVRMGERAAALAREDNNPHLASKILAIVAEALLRQREFDRSVATGRDAVGLARTAKSLHSEAAALTVVAHAFLRKGDVEKAVATSERAAAQAHAAEDRALEAKASLLAAWASVKQGDCDRAVGAGERAARLARDAKDPRVEAAAMVTIAEALLRMGNLDRAIATGEEAAALAREVDDTSLEAKALAIVAEALHRRGSPELAATVGERAANLARSAKKPYWEATALVIVARALISTGDHDRAVTTSELAAVMARKTAATALEAEANAIVADAKRLLNDFDGAAAIAETAASLARDANDPDVEASSLAIAADALLRSGKLERVAPMSEQAAALARQGERPALEARALLIAAYAAHLRGELEKATATYSQVLSIARATGDRHLEAECLHGIGTVNASEGHYDEGLRLLADAERLAGLAGASELAAGARHNRFLTLLDRAGDHALAGRTAKASADLEEAGANSAAEPEEKALAALHGRVFRRLLEKNSTNAVRELSRSLGARNKPVLDAYGNIVRTVAEELCCPGGNVIGELPPFERGLAYEILRQVQGSTTLKEGLELAEKGDSRKAVETLSGLLQESPDDLSALRAAALAALGVKNTEAAERWIRQALVVSDGAAEDAGDLGLVYQQKGAREQANKMLADAVGKGSTKGRHYLALAALQAAEGDWKKAVGTAQAALRLRLNPEETVCVRLNLAEYSRLFGQNEDADKALAGVDAASLAPNRKTAYLFHLCLSRMLQGDASAVSVAAQDFCQHLLDHGALAVSNYDFRELLRYAHDHALPAGITLLDRWADVATGSAGLAEFVRAYGSETQMEHLSAIHVDESDLALNRLAQGRVRSLADLRATSTREDAVQVGLLAVASAYGKLPVEQQGIARSLILEGLGSSEPPISRAAVMATGQVFWGLPPEERSAALSGLLSLPSRNQTDSATQETAVRVVGAIYFQLEPIEQKTVADTLRTIAKDNAASWLHEVLSRIESTETTKRV